VLHKGYHPSSKRDGELNSNRVFFERLPVIEMIVDLILGSWGLLGV
jgi:hypothetical protein